MGDHKFSPDERLDAEDRGTYDLKNDGVPEEERESGTAGLPDKDNVPEETIESIESERQERLSAENRPDGAEVDNTQRTFDADAGTFTDSDRYREDDKPYA
jgi:hypothetical protein